MRLTQPDGLSLRDGRWTWQRACEKWIGVIYSKTEYLTETGRGKGGKCRKGGEGSKAVQNLCRQLQHKKPNQYYPESLVIKFNGLLSLRSLQQHRKKCLFPLTSHLYCWMLALLSLSPPPLPVLDDISGLSATIKQTVSRDRGVCQLETAPLPSLPKVIPH